MRLSEISAANKAIPIASTVILIDRNNHVIFSEKNFIGSQEQLSEVNYEFDLT